MFTKFIQDKPWMFDSLVFIRGTNMQWRSASLEILVSNLNASDNVVRTKPFKLNVELYYDLHNFHLHPGESRLQNPEWKRNKYTVSINVRRILIALKEVILVV